MGGSKSKSSSKPVDMTPGAFKDLQGPFADVVGNLVGQFVPQGTQKIMQGYTGPTTSPITGSEQNALNAVNQAAQNPGNAPAGSVPSQQPNAPFVQNAIQQAAGAPRTSAGPSQASQDLLASTALTGNAAGAQNFVQGLGIGGGPQQSLGDFRNQLGAASQTGAFGGNGSNPFLQSAIEAAQRPTLQGLEETLSRTLPGRFTQAGHIIQPGGSSAFDRAAAIASRGATQELGDIATRMSYNAFEAAQGREATSLENELARRGQMGLQTQNLEAGAMQNQLDRALQVPGMEAQLQQLGANTDLALAQLPTQAAETALRLAQARGQEAGTGLTQAQTGTQNAQTDLTASQVRGNEVDTAIKNLQAQALPRLIQDMGVERGIEAFNNNVNSLLATLGIASGVTRPVVANESKSSSGSFQLK